jgi:hypothetical protein
VYTVEIVRDTQSLRVEQTLDDCTLEDVAGELPAQQPRFVLISYAWHHADGRVNYPLALLFYTPPGACARSPRVHMHRMQPRSANVVRG